MSTNLNRLLSVAILDKFWANEESSFDYKAWQRFCKMLLNLMLHFCYYAL